MWCFISAKSLKDYTSLASEYDDPEVLDTVGGQTEL